MAIMIDLETIGLVPECVILSCGAIAFEPRTNTVYNDTGTTWWPSLEEQRELGRLEDPRTIEWWTNQAPEAQATSWAVPEEERIGLTKFYDDLRNWMSTNDQPYKMRKVWSNGAGFDIAILENLFRMLKADPPWAYWNIRDTRTVWDLTPSVKQGQNLLAHDALSDATEQAERVCRSYLLLVGADEDRYS